METKMRFLVSIFMVFFLTFSSAFTHMPNKGSYITYGKRINTDSQSQLMAAPSFSIVTLGYGSLGLMIILVNRLSISLEAVSDVQSRSDIISVISLSALLLSSLSDQEIATRERPSVALAGYALKGVDIKTENGEKLVTSKIEWLLNSLRIINTVTSVHLFLDGLLIARCGVVDSEKSTTNQCIPATMPILTEVIRSKKQVYLPDLQILPGKIEFTYLPINCQSVLVVPLYDRNGAVIIATNKAKSFESSDLEKAVATIEAFEGIA